MHKPRIDTDAALQWASAVVDRAIAAGDVDLGARWTDQDIQEYEIAAGIAVDGIYQDRDADAEPRPWWAFWRA
jgi:hypothetical protein